MWIIKRDFFLLWNTYKSTLGLKKSMVAVEWTIFHFVMPHDPKNQSPRSPSTIPWIVLLNKGTDSKHIFIQHCSSPRKFTLFLLHFDRRNLYARANFVSILCIKLKEFISLKQKLWSETNKRVMLFFFDKAVFLLPRLFTKTGGKFFLMIAVFALASLLFNRDHWAKTWYVYQRWKVKKIISLICKTVILYCINEALSLLFLNTVTFGLRIYSMCLILCMRQKERLKSSSCSWLFNVYTIL